MKPALLPESQRYSILMVDNTPANIGILTEFLEDFGFNVIVARNVISNSFLHMFYNGMSKWHPNTMQAMHQKSLKASK